MTVSLVAVFMAVGGRPLPFRFGCGEAKGALKSYVVIHGFVVGADGICNRELVRGDNGSW